MNIVHYFKVAKHFYVWQHEFWLALCHDLVEDGYLHPFILKYWTSLDAITRKKDERYFDYIYRVKQNESSTKVKLADLEENIKRCSDSLKKRYIKAQSILTL